MPNDTEFWGVAEIMRRYNISRMTIHRRVKEGILNPVNTAPALYRQHKLLFRPDEVIAALGQPADETTVEQS